MMFNECPIIRKIRDTYTLHTVIRSTVDVLISCLWVRSLSSFSNCARCSMIMTCPPEEDLPVHLLVHHCFMPSSCLFHKNNECQCHYLWAPMRWRLGDKDTRLSRIASQIEPIQSGGNFWGSQIQKEKSRMRHATKSSTSGQLGNFCHGTGDHDDPKRMTCSSAM